MLCIALLTARRGRGYVYIICCWLAPSHATSWACVRALERGRVCARAYARYATTPVADKAGTLDLG